MSRTEVRAFPTGAPTDLSLISAAQLNLLMAEIDELRTRLAGTGIINATVLAIGSTDDQIGSTAFQYHINGVSYHKAAVAAGTAPGAQTVTADKWALYRLSIDSAGTITVTPAAANVAGYATEALAIAALPATPANEADMGYVTVLTGDGTAWIAATDAFEGGAAGNPATTTNYYPADPTVGAVQAGTLSYSR